jgi:hypothetical protein
MNRPLTLLLLLAGCAAARPALAALDRATLVGLGASVLRIEAPTVQGGFSLGSGVVVGDDIVVTNCHVTRDATEVRIVQGALRWVAAAQASDVSRDLCLLRVPGLKAPAAPWGRADGLAAGQAVTAIGYTGGTSIQSSSGEVVKLHRHEGAPVIQSDNWFSSGASGGGLFDEHGKLVGILTFRLRGGLSHYFAAPSEWVQKMMSATATERFRPVMPMKPGLLAYWELPQAQQPRFMQAASLLRDRRWGDLIQVASDWSRAEPDDGEPWSLLGVALEHLGRLPEAQHAYDCSKSPVSRSCIDP